LLSKDYEVHGIVRRASTFNTDRLDEIYVDLHEKDVRVSFDQAEYTADVWPPASFACWKRCGIFKHRSGHTVRVYQAGSSEIFGAASPAQSETTPFYPRSPYAASKVAAHWYAVNYREAYQLFVSNGILFNHESERRGETFVTRKITRALARISLGLQRKLYFGNLDAKRDWGYARDYVQATWRILQYREPGDFVVSTGESHSVREFPDLAAATRA